LKRINKVQGVGEIMPLYEYKCDCGEVFATHQSITDDSLPQCPECGEKTVKRCISTGTGFVLAGSGWARDGYRGK
jgi:putative FmdB family regulatory protein